MDMTKLVDIRVSQTTSDTVVNLFQEQNVAFHITVSNYPVSGIGYDANNTFVQNILPSGFVAVGWTAEYFNGASGPASGSGNLVTSIPVLPYGGYVKYIFDCSVKVSANTGSVENKVLVSVSGDRAPFNVNNTVSVLGLHVWKRRTEVSVNVLGVGSFIKGKTSRFVVEILNLGTVDIINGSLQSFLPDGVLLDHWVASYVDGAAGAVAGVDSFIMLDLPANSSVTYTFDVWVEPDAPLGAASNKVTFFFPDDVDSNNGLSCVSDQFFFQITNFTTLECRTLCGCLRELVCNDNSVPVGYVIVKLVTPDGVRAYDPVSRKPIMAKQYKFPIDSNGCWQTGPLPVNSQLITKRTGEKIPSYYEVFEYAGSQSASVVNPSIDLQGKYKGRFSADVADNGCINVVDFDETNAKFDLFVSQFADGAYSGPYVPDESFLNSTDSMPFAVSSSVVSTVMLEPNTYRKGVLLNSTSSGRVWLKYGVGASSSSFTYVILPGGYWEMTGTLYTGVISVIFETNDGELIGSEVV